MLTDIFSWDQNYEDIYKDFTRDFLKAFWMSSEKIDKALKLRNELKLHEYEEYLDNEKVEIITIHDFWYPKSLLKLKSPPYLLYVKWTIWNEKKIWIVWSRKMTTYWWKVLNELMPEISGHFTVVSWGAAWVDTAAHSECLDSNWKTIVCVWTWIDKIYPAPNKKMFEKVVEKGWAIVSIFPIWTPWDKHTFPIRNEIIVWLSDWVLVVEAQEKSWSLITARYTLENNKSLFAVPGEFTKSQSKWTNSLIKSWKAKMVLWPDDIIKYFWLETPIKKPSDIPEFENDLDKSIFELLLWWPLLNDDIAAKLQKKITDVSLRLSMLELSGIIARNFSWKYEVK